MSRVWPALDRLDNLGYNAIERVFSVNTCRNYMVSAPTVALVTKVLLLHSVYSAIVAEMNLLLCYNIVMLLQNKLRSNFGYCQPVSHIYNCIT